MTPTHSDASHGTRLPIDHHFAWLGPAAPAPHNAEMQIARVWRDVLLDVSHLSRRSTQRAADVITVTGWTETGATVHVPLKAVLQVRSAQRVHDEDDLRLSGRLESSRHGHHVFLGFHETLLCTIDGTEIICRTVEAENRELATAPSEPDAQMIKILVITALVFWALVTIAPSLSDSFGEDTVDSLKPYVLSAHAYWPPPPPPKTREVRSTIKEPSKPGASADKRATGTAKRATKEERVQAALASLFGGMEQSRVFTSGGPGDLDRALNNLHGPNNNALDGPGVPGGSRGSPGGGPGTEGLSIGGPGALTPHRLPGGFPGGGLSRRATVPPEPTRINGEGLDKESISRVVKRHMSEVKFCYESALASNASLAGKIAVTWTIDATGAVASADVAESSLNSEAVERCVLDRIRRWRFPEPRGGGVVVVTYPWVLRTAADE